MSDMYKARIKFEGANTICFGRAHNIPLAKINGKAESHEEHERRTWINKIHEDKEGNVLVTSFAIKNMLSEAAKFMSIKTKGTGTFTKHFEAGLMCMDDMVIGKKENIRGQWMFVPSDGKRGGSKRVSKCFPMLEDWSGEVDILILDPTITQDALNQHLIGAGMFIGLGSLRPRNNGVLGRFNASVTSFEPFSYI